METNHCKKCGREISPDKKKCENCKKKTQENWKKVGGGAAGIAGMAGAAFLAVVKKK